MNRKVVDAWFDAFREKDISKLELTDDFVHTSPFGVIRGRRAYLDLVNENPACDCIYVRDGQISEIFSYYHVGEKPVLYDD